MKIIVCNSKVPFVHGGGELLIQWLITQLKCRGFDVEEIAIPLMWKSEQDLLKSNLVWRLLELREALEIPADIVIGTKFPSYLVKHPRKVIWLFHQFKQIYEGSGSDAGYKCDTVAQLDATNKIMHLDNCAFSEAHKIYCLSEKIGKKVKKYNGFDSETLYPFPPDKKEYTCEEYGDYILHVGKLGQNKRIELIIEALRKSAIKTKIIFAGDGARKNELEKRVAELGLSENIIFSGWIERKKLLDLYARASAIVYAALDEDFSLIPTEAFLCKKPVIATSDAGGMLEIVKDGETGIITEPGADGLARGFEMAAMNKNMLVELGNNGYNLVNSWSWDTIIEKLTS